jgi:hypothetical protein
MCLATPHDKVRGLGLGLMYEKHWASGFRDLSDSASPDRPATGFAHKGDDLRAFESAGATFDELVGHYRQASAPGRGGDGGRRVRDSLPMTLRASREAGYCPRPPGDLAAAAAEGCGPAQ